MKPTLDSADATAACAMHLMAMTDDLKSGDAWKYRAFLDDAMADDPNVLAVLQRNIRALELLAGAMKELRAGIMTAQAARGER